MLVCLDDKNRVKVGEPGLPVASVERGKGFSLPKPII